ncbi:MAG: hypothetical protein M1831_001046 [Alyxoria varia]|nr:MAG: hypothetical protein M1831_001046 [Alyxoria varia]
MPHNGGPPAFNPAGYAYSIFIIIYTIFIVSSLAVLTAARNTPAVRLRGLGIIVTSVLALHVYVAALFIVYPLNGQYKCNTEFWYMSIILPLGMAMFQAGNARLVSVTKIQAELLMSGRWSAERPAFSFKPKQFKSWYQGLSYHGKHYLWIFVALILQTVLTLFLYYGSRRFNDGHGIFGEHVDEMSCRQGFEWIPSVVWQFTWICIFGGLLGTPMWLAFLYSGNNPSIKQLNGWWPPALWFAPGLITMQVSTIGFALYDAYEKPLNDLTKTLSRSSSSMFFYDEKKLQDNDPSRPSALMIEAFGTKYARFLDQISYNFEPLAQFGAKKALVLENMEFIRRVRNLKRVWRKMEIENRESERRGRIGLNKATQSPDNGDVGLLPHDKPLEDELTRSQRRAMYIECAHIYYELVNQHTSRYNINIDSKMTKVLASYFDKLNYAPSRSSMASSSEESSDSDDSMLHRDNAIPEFLMQDNFAARSHHHANPRPRAPTPEVAAARRETYDGRRRVIIDRDGERYFSPGATPEPVSPMGTPLSQLDGPTVITDSEDDSSSLPSSSSASFVDSEIESSNSRAALSPSPFTVPPPPATVKPAQAAANVAAPPKDTVEDLLSSLRTSENSGRILSKVSAESVPHNFSISIFDEADQHIKKLTYVNNWVQFVKWAVGEMGAGVMFAPTMVSEDGSSTVLGSKGEVTNERNKKPGNQQQKAHHQHTANSGGADNGKHAAAAEGKDKMRRSYLILGPTLDEQNVNGHVPKFYHGHDLSEPLLSGVKPPEAAARPPTARGGPPAGGGVRAGENVGLRAGAETGGSGRGEATEGERGRPLTRRGEISQSSEGVSAAAAADARDARQGEGPCLTFSGICAGLPANHNANNSGRHGQTTTLSSRRRGAFFGGDETGEASGQPNHHQHNNQNQQRPPPSPYPSHDHTADNHFASSSTAPQHNPHAAGISETSPQSPSSNPTFISRIQSPTTSMPEPIATPASTLGSGLGESATATSPPPPFQRTSSRYSNHGPPASPGPPFQRQRQRHSSHYSTNSHHGNNGNQRPSIPSTISTARGTSLNPGTNPIFNLPLSLTFRNPNWSNRFTASSDPGPPSGSGGADVGGSRRRNKGRHERDGSGVSSITTTTTTESPTAAEAAGGQIELRDYRGVLDRQDGGGGGGGAGAGSHNTGGVGGASHGRSALGAAANAHTSSACPGEDDDDDDIPLISEHDVQSGRFLDVDRTVDARCRRCREREEQRRRRAWERERGWMVVGRAV